MKVLLSQAEIGLAHDREHWNSWEGRCIGSMRVTPQLEVINGQENT